jgi:UDP-N-acetylglucosamine--N-acetylmuramyl-(pentapeptide) pyrophosphoryl-undecaprenol N-acetylglucosamine transferase
MNTIVVTGGGTGGHLSVARAFIKELHQRGYKIIFMGSTKGADKAWFEDDNTIYKKYFLDTKGVVNQKGLGKIISLLMILKAVVKSILIFRKYNVSKIISVGGFSAAPASFGAIITKRDFYIHEQNSIMGKLNKITSKYAKYLFSSYDSSCDIKDYPISQEFFQKARVRENIKTVIFLGGSQGARAINDFALEIASLLVKNNIKIIHQAGRLDFQRVQQKYKDLNIEADVFDFTTNLLEKMDQADFAISRAGASTLWELSAIGLPTLFIPYPYAAANHQYYNAKFLEDQNLCFIKNEKDLTIKDFEDILKSDIQTISKNLIKTIKPNGVKSIIDKILESQEQK